MSFDQSTWPAIRSCFEHVITQFRRPEVPGEGGGRRREQILDASLALCKRLAPSWQWRQQDILGGDHKPTGKTRWVLVNDHGGDWAHFTPQLRLVLRQLCRTLASSQWVCAAQDEAIVYLETTRDEIDAALCGRPGLVAAQPTPIQTPKGSKIAIAIGYLTQHPDWTNERIAAAVPCNAKYLSQDRTFRTAKKAIKDAGKAEAIRSKRHRGRDMDEYEDEG